MNRIPTTPQRSGPPVYENWRAAIQGLPSSGAYEVPLFTDAMIVGEIMDGYGPYQLINTIAHASHPQSLNVLPAIVLRIEEHRADHETDILNTQSQTNEDLYHGGMMPDEVAALVSLALGIRLIAGGVNREFDPDHDPRGRPIAHYHVAIPQFPQGNQSLVVPRAIGRHTLDDITPLRTLPVLTREDAIALVRAARLYQQAMWIVETDPALSWLLFVQP